MCCKGNKIQSKLANSADAVTLNRHTEGNVIANSTIYTICIAMIEMYG